MKRIFTLVCIAVIGMTSAFAQKKGDMAVGINLGVAPCLEKSVDVAQGVKDDIKVTNFGIGVKFQYNILDALRVEADAEYWFRNNYNDMADAFIDVHYLFNVGSKIKVYPLVGVGYAKYGIKDYHMKGVLVNAGVGGECALARHISAGLEIKYQYVKDFQRLPITLGVTYRF